MKLPCLSVRASLIVLKPSRINETSAPASGLPRLSRTVPLIVASDLPELAATASLATKDAMKDTSAIRDKLKPNAFLMRQRPPRPKSLLEALDRQTGSGRGDVPEPPETSRYCLSWRKLLSSLLGLVFSAALCVSLRSLRKRGPF